MPYTLDTLPENVSKLDSTKKKQWLHVFNGSIEAGDDESTAFAKANGVVKKELIEEAKSFDTESEYSLISRITDAVKAFVLKASPGGPVHATPFLTMRQKDGSLRWFAWVSNNFRDKEKEIIPEYAHKEFVKWVDTEKAYPELWVWHVPYRLGSTDWVEYADGFLCASGLVDKDKEDTVTAIQQLGMPLGMSHGFKALQSIDGTIVRYWSHEFSVLPAENAASIQGGTGFAVLTKEEDVAFSEAKKGFLQKIGIPDAQIGTLEQQTEAMSKSLRDAGFEWKETPDPEGGVVVGVGESEYVTKADLAPILQQNGQIMEALGLLANKATTTDTAVKSLSDAVAAVQKSDDEKIASTIEAAISKSPGGYKASESTKNIVDKSDDSLKTANEPSWFVDTVLKDLVPQA